MHTLRLSPRLQNQELCGERGRIHLPVQQPSTGCVWTLVLETPGSRAFSTPLPGTCSSSFESYFNLDFVLSLSTPFVSLQPRLQLAITDDCSSLV